MNNKKTIIILILVLTIGIVGLTVAYFSNSTSIDNTFTTRDYGTTTDEDFVSPDNWLPGTTTPKTLIVTNSGNVDEAVRISYTETWTSKNAKDNNQEGDLPLKQNNNDVAIINWANTDDWTTVTENGVTYKYYKYKLAPTETTTSLLDSVTFNSAAVNNSNCVEDTPEAGKKVITCDSTGNGYDGATYKLRFNVETVQYNQYRNAWGTSVALLSAKPMNIQQFIASKSNPVNAAYNDNTKTSLFVMTHPATAQTPQQTEYRYIGNNPYNYVYFNCDSLDNQNSSTCEVWRIIGVFDVDDGTGNYEQRIKIVRGSALPDEKQWDTRTSEMYPNDNLGKNEWVGSLMQTYLNDNGDYYTRTGTAANYGLKSTAKNLISNSKYYLGGASYNNGYGTADAMYLWERGNEVYNQNNATRSTSWVGKVALMYPSDQYLVYANGVENDCYNSPHTCGASWVSVHGDPTLGWIYNSNNLEGQSSSTTNWLVSPYSGHSSDVFTANSDGHLSNDRAKNSHGVRPVLYLSSNVKITSGTGEQNNPFKLGL